MLSVGIVGAGPWLSGGTKETRLITLYTVSVAVRNRRPRDSFPRWYWMEAVLSLSWRCDLAIVLYPG